MICSRGSTSLRLALVLLPLAGCTTGSGSEAEGTHVDRVFSGYVIDEQGSPVVGALVESDDGLLSGTTDGLGQFVILNEVDDGRPNLTLLVNKDGYLGNTADIPLVDTTSHYTTLVTLTEAKEVQTLDSDKGGTLAFNEGKLLLSFQGGGFADIMGNQVDGSVDVTARLIEPESLRPDRLPVPSMEADDPTTPDQNVLISSFGMFLMEAYQDGTRVYPASGTTFSAEITGIERFVESGALQKDSYIPLWTMDETASKWQYAGWWSVVPSEVEEGTTKTSSAEDDDDYAGSDNSRYSIVTDVPVGTGSGQPPPPVPRYNCDARPILSCVRGRIGAEGLHNDEDSTTHLTTTGVSGAWVGFSGTGQAELCSVCECEEQKSRVVCTDVTNPDGTTSEFCEEQLYTETTNQQPDNSGVTDNACSNPDPNKNCTCTRWETQSVSYQGAAYTNADGEYCANVGSGGIINSVKVLKDWMITETDPRTNQVSSYVISYEYSENPRMIGPPRTVCEDGAGLCGVWNHEMPCEWFWANGGCAVVGGCEVFHLRGYDDEEEDD